MGKGVSRSYENLIEITLGKQIVREKKKFADVTIQDFQRDYKVNKLISAMKGWTFDTDWLEKSKKE